VALDQEMDRLFEDFGFGRSLMPGFGRDLFSHAFGDFSSQAQWSPQVEMFERYGKLIIRADLPGLSKEDVQVEVADNTLTISGEHRSEHQENREGYYHSERSYGSFFRQLPLPEGINADDANATFNKGVLEITMPSPEKQKSGRRLEIKDSGENAKQS
jgi:HSP20 family protein